jgi:HK97 family phage major capsid protein
MTTQVSNRLAELNPYVQELASLSSLEHPSRQQNMRMTSLMSIISALKSGSSVDEIRRWEMDELRKAAGLSRMPDAPKTALGQETESEWRKFAKGEPVRPTNIPSDTEIRANEAGTATVSLTEPTVGGYFVAPQMHSRFWESMKEHDQIFEPWASNQIETSNGAIMQIPSADDVANQSVQIGETSQSTEVDIFNFGQVQLNAYTFRSKMVAVSLELLEDSNFAIGAVLERIFASRHALGVGSALVTGSGTASPTGLLTATTGSGASPVIATGSSANDGSANTGANSIGTADLVNLYKSLNPAMRPGANWYMSDGTFLAIATLINKYGSLLLPELFTGNGRDNYLFNHRIAICNSMPSIASGHNSVVFAQPDYFTVRTVPSATYVRRYSQSSTLILNGLCGFESFFRCDSNLVSPNASFLPAQYLQNHS